MRTYARTRCTASLVLAVAFAMGSAVCPPQTPAKADPIQQRKDQLAADSARLLKLATELKVAVDKTTKDQLSIAVVKKADEVEKLARKVRDEMKTVPAN